MLLGCAVGLVNVPRIKGNHNAMLSGKAAAEHAHAAIQEGREGDTLEGYHEELRTGPVGQDLKRVRNVKPIWSRMGLYASMGLGGFDMWAQQLTGFSPFGTMRHGKTDAEATGLASDHKVIEYPKPDGRLSFDKLTNVAFSGTNHEEHQPCHLKLRDPKVPVEVNWPRYAGLSQRYCPAGVYEFVDDEGGGKRFQINFQNCVHCKTCDIKDPQPEHRLDRAPGGGRAELPQHVSASSSARPVSRDRAARAPIA